MLWNEVKTYYKFGGLKAAIIFLGIRFMNKIMYFDILHTMTLQTKDVDEKYLMDPEGGLKGRFLTREEIESFAKDPKYSLTEDFLPESLSNEDRCFGFVDNGKLAAYGWYSTQPTKVTTEFNVNFGSKWVYMHHGYTNPEYRGKRLHAIGMAQAARSFEQNGFNGLVSIVASDNSNSLKSVKRMGYKLTGKIFLFARLNRYLVFQNFGAKEAGMWLSPRDQNINAVVLNRPNEEMKSAS